MASAAGNIVIKATGRHTATVIFAHGLGDTGKGWLFLVENFLRRQVFPEVKFILPTAPVIPVTCNFGVRMNAWYDIAALDRGDEYLRQNEDGPGILRSKDIFHALVQDEVAAGIPSDRIVLGGFSQGGAMSIISGITSTVKLGGIIGLSSYLLFSAKLAEVLPKGDLLANKQTPILMGHGSSDQVVSQRLGERSRDLLKEEGFNVAWKSYPGMGHEACPEEIDDVQKFLEKCLPPKDKTEL